jgi:transcriptional regulator
MYLPAHFAEERLDVLHAAIAANPLATLVTLQGGEVVADEIPFVLDASTGGMGTLRAHVARANPLWSQHQADKKIVAVFKGLQAYISPSWYATKAEHGKVVPTWNYIIVQATGLLQHKDGDATWLRDQLDTMTDSQERRLPQPWKVGDAPDDYIAQMMRAIVGIEIPLERLIGKWKVSQNQPAANRTSVVAALQHHAEPMARAVQERMK